MADQPLTIQAIDWREAFPFTHLFRAFRVAIHPSKLVLGLVALLLMYFGGTVLDYICPVRDRAVPQEVQTYEVFLRQPHDTDKFSDGRDAQRRLLESNYAARLLQYNLVPNAETAMAAAQGGRDLSQLKAAILERRDKAVAQAQLTRNLQLAAARSMPNRRAVESATSRAQNQCNAAMLAIYREAAVEYQHAKDIRGEGLFADFFSYELNQISNVVTAVREGNFFGEASEDAAASTLLPMGSALEPPASPSTNLAVNNNNNAGNRRPGVFQATARFFTIGPVWLLSQHPVFFVILGAYFLVLWAIFGGAISRIAAVHFARDEKLSIRSALKFSVSKFFSFLCAPIIPLLIVVVVGLLVALGALVGNIPWVGAVVLGVFFFLALAGGFVMALVLLGLVGGFNLMYPTIAVEGSDSFDAISRSFSYLYARPWRLAFYTLVAVVYGALTYLFVRLFIFVMLIMAHWFVGLSFFVHAESTAPLWSSMWPSPITAARLSYDVDFLSLNAGQFVGAVFVWCWVYLMIAMLGAFTISFYFSSNTIIYYLMRREVDATDLDDVYLEPVDDEFAEPLENPAAVSPSSPLVPPPPPAPAESGSAAPPSTAAPLAATADEAVLPAPAAAPVAALENPPPPT